VTPCSLIERYQHFEGIYCLHFEGREKSEGEKATPIYFFLALYLYPCFQHDLTFYSDGGGKRCSTACLSLSHTHTIISCLSAGTGGTHNVASNVTILNASCRFLLRGYAKKKKKVPCLSVLRTCPTYVLKPCVSLQLLKRYLQ
jgi:hypothetical protein